MKDSDKKILLVILALAILALTYMYVVSPARKDIDTLETENAALQTKYNDLKAKEANRDQYLAETEQYNQEFNNEVAKYAPDLNQEGTVMFLKGVEEQLDFVNVSESLGKPEQFYILGKGETAGTEVVEGEETSEDNYVCYKAAYPISYKGTYEGLKNYLNYVNTYKYRMNITSINATYDPVTKECSGSVGLNMYEITGPDRKADTVDVDVPNGVNNIFVGGSGSNSAVAAATYKYDSNAGADITATHNMVILLNNAANDTASGIIVAADEKDENTYVDSTDNAIVDLKVSVYSADGKNFISYEIGDKKYEKEILTEDVTVYVKSSARVDANDANGVNVTVANTTSLPVFFKVADDDSTSPRFKVASKSGVVKVY